MVRKEIVLSGIEGEKVYAAIYIAGEEISTIRGTKVTISAVAEMIFINAGAHLQTLQTKGFKITDIRRGK